MRAAQQVFMVQQQRQAQGVQVAGSPVPAASDRIVQPEHLLPHLQAGWLRTHSR